MAESASVVKGLGVDNRLVNSFYARYTNSRMSDASLHIMVKPKSPRNEVVRTPDGLLVRVTASPVEGAANTAVIKTLAQALGVPKSRLAITGGATGRLKRVAITGLTQDEVDSRVALLPAAG